MKTLLFVIITIFSGAVAGIILGLINQGIIEPFIDKAISIETEQQIIRGENIDTTQQAQYRVWQKAGEVVAATLYGVSLSALFGLVFFYSRRSLPGFNNKKKGLFLAAIMFFVLFLMPALKYPPNPPAVGNPATIYSRQILYVGFIIISSSSALALGLLYRRLTSYYPERTVLLILSSIYAATILCAYLAFPPNPDAVAIPANLIISFRIASIFTIGLFWGILGMTLGMFWDKFKPHETDIIASSDSFIGRK